MFDPPGEVRTVLIAEVFDSVKGATAASLAGAAEWALPTAGRFVQSLLGTHELGLCHRDPSWVWLRREPFQ
jgi:hypothetical protein